MLEGILISLICVYLSVAEDKRIKNYYIKTVLNLTQVTIRREYKCV